MQEEYAVSSPKMQSSPLLWIAVATAMTVLALPIAAQQTDASPSATSPAQVQTGTTSGPSSSAPQTSTTNEQLDRYNAQYASAQSAPQPQPKKEGFWGHLNPFASKGWVKRQVTPVQDRLQEVKELSAFNAQQLRDLDAHTQAGLNKANTTAQAASNNAQQAASMADQAQSTALLANSHTQQLRSTIDGIDQYQNVSQVEIRFPGSRDTLGKQGKSELDQVASKVQWQKGYLIEVQGYSSLRGRAGLAASQRTAAAVARYLYEAHQVPLYRIREVALGNAPMDANGDQTASGTHASTRIHGNIVEVRVVRNSLSTLSASTNADLDDSPVGAAQPGPAQSSSNEVVPQPTQYE
jgi:outer membrane protein OmpA-like peptidoglycan-associated protein